MNCGFAHSTIGVLTQTSTQKTDQRVTYDMQYYVNRSKGAGNSPVPFFQQPNASDPSYWWVVSGAASYEHQSIVLMAQVIAPSPSCGGFAVEGSTLISIDNVADDPSDWTYGSARVPNTDACTNWFVGMAHTDGKDSDEVYVLGTHGKLSHDKNGCAVCSNSSVVLARANISALQDLAWSTSAEYWCESTAPPSSSKGGTWTRSCTNDRLRPLFTPTDCGAPNCAISEMSLVYNFYICLLYTSPSPRDRG